MVETVLKIFLAISLLNVLDAIALLVHVKDVVALVNADLVNKEYKGTLK